jgi:hypothetical protein
MNSLNFLYFYNLFYEWTVGLVTFSVVTVFMSKVIWTFLSVALLFSIIIIKQKLGALRLAEKEALELALRQVQTRSESETNHVWEKIIGYLNSDNPSDWKLAILESDTILDSLMQKMGYRGENLGERLKAVEPSDFVTLNDAWEAHKIRNAIAHEAGYDLTQREAKRVIKLFENVFREFGYL